MVNSQQLQKETSAFLNKEVLAVGIFDAVSYTHLTLPTNDLV